MTAWQPESPSYPGDLQRFARSLARDGEPGLAIGVYAGGILAGHGVAGCAVAEHGVPVTEHTLFDIASVSKHMTATCLLLVARDGVIDLDADIRPALPELAIEVPVTLRQCLSHTAGLRDYFTLCEIAGIGVPGMTEDRFTDLITGQRELDFPPGSAFSYSNTGYALASVLVRRMTGNGLAQVAAERVFGPLHMTATGFRDDVSRPVPRLAAGYVAAGTGREAGFRRYDSTEEVTGDGAVVTSLTDLAAWHGFLASGAILGPDIRDGLLATRALTGGASTGYGLGLQAIRVDGRPAWWHSGSWAGYRAALVYLPELQAGVTVLASRNDRYASHVALAAAAALLGDGDPAARYRANPMVANARAADPARAASELAGVWHEPEQDVFLDVVADGGQLVIGAGGENGGRDRFELGADGRWHGIGTASASCYAADGGELVAAWGLSDRSEGRFRRAEPATGDSDGGRAVPAGWYRNDELQVQSGLRADGPGARITIGLAPARPLVPAGPGVWRCRGGDQPGSTQLTVRAAADGAELLVSAPGARRVRFTRVPGAGSGPELPRGLRGWAR
ncbi:MAG: serine hydrolase domain-containing protein [Streptosporangiaceae bacterium]